MFDETGGTPLSRAREAKELLSQLEDHHDDLKEKELEFIQGLSERIEKFGDMTIVSPRQLFWLRDIRDRVAL